MTERIMDIGSVHSYLTDIIRSEKVRVREEDSVVTIIPVDLREARWQDPVSLAALEESKKIEANPGAYKRFDNAADLIADCLEGDDDE